MDTNNDNKAFAIWVLNEDGTLTFSGVEYAPSVEALNGGQKDDGWEMRRLRRPKRP